MELMLFFFKLFTVGPYSLHHTFLESRHKPNALEDGKVTNSCHQESFNFTMLGRSTKPETGILHYPDHAGQKCHLSVLSKFSAFSF